MARLPDSIDSAAPQGQRPSTAAVRPTDFGLGDLAQGVERFAEATKVRDEKTADAILLQEQARLEPGLAERAAAYDGRESGFANREVGQFDSAMASVLARDDVPEGVRLALRAKVDGYKQNYGQRAISLEASKRGGVVADQEKVKLAHRVGERMIGFNTDFGARYQALADSYDGSQPDFAGQTLAAFDEAAQAQIEAAPDDLKVELQGALEAKRVAIHAGALDTQAKGHDAYVATAAKTASQELVNSVLTNPALYETSGDDIERAGAGLPAALRVPFQNEVRGQLAEARIRGLILKGDLPQAKAELESGRYDKILKPDDKLRLTAAVRAEGADRARNLIEAVRYGGDVDPGALTTAAGISGDPGLQAHADYAIAVGAAEPGALTSLAGGRGAKAQALDAINFVIDDLEGGDALIVNDNGRGASRFGINQAANPDLKVATLNRASAVARYRTGYWKAVGADQLPPPLALVAFDAAVLFGPEKAKGWLAQAQGDPGKFQELEVNAMRALAKADPAKYGDDLKGWLNRVAKVRDKAASLQAIANAQDGISSDPIKFAMGTATRQPLGAIAPLPENPADDAFGQALVGRFKVGRQMNATYRAPLRMMTEGEATFYRDMIDRDPMAGLAIAEQAVKAVGPAAARSLMGELGRRDSASVQVHLADLHAAGNANYSRMAATGLALRAKGAELPKAEKDEIAAEVERLKPLFAGQPELPQIVRATAEAAALAQSQTGAALSGAANVMSALGGSMRGGKLYGGVAEVNGGRTLLPPWLANDHADDVLEYLALGWDTAKTGPVYANGSPMPQDRIAKLRPVLMPTGRYRLVGRDGVAAQAPKGGAFEFDLDRAAPRLRAKFGRAVVQDGW